MPYLQDISQIEATIQILTQASILWMDTEVADYNTSRPRLSLIQVSAHPYDQTGTHTYMLDVLDREELINTFINQIMSNSRIEKIFHNARYDRQFLGEEKAKNVTCTLEMAKQIPYYILPVKNYKLKTLTEELCFISHVNKEEQGSDWGQRPLTHQQLEYAKLDIVYLTKVYHKLQQILNYIKVDPYHEDIIELDTQYAQIVGEWEELDEKLTEIKNRIKAAMLSQQILEYEGFKLLTYETKKMTTNFINLADVVLRYGVDLNFPIRLTKELQKQLGNLIKEPSLSLEEVTTWRLTPREKKTKPPEKKLPDPQTENLAELVKEYHQVLFEWKFFDSEMEAVKGRIKQAMMSQNVKETPHFKLSSSVSLQVDFLALAQLIQSLEFPLNYPLTLTQEIQEKLGNLLTEIDKEIEPNTLIQLKFSQGKDQNESSKEEKPNLSQKSHKTPEINSEN